MLFPPEFFTLNLQFARRAAHVLGQPFPEVLLNYTHLYLLLGLGRAFDSTHTIWQTYVQSLASAADETAYTHAFYLQHLPPITIPHPAFGCFSYGVWEGGRIRLHFRNAEPPGVSPLARERVTARVAELRELFTYVRENIPHAHSVVGGSWLYHLEAYRRLFPPTFTATAQPEYADVQFLALWGQFLNHAEQIKVEVAQKFRENMEQATDLDSLLKSFPYVMLRLETGIEAFYAFYGM